MTRFKLSGVQTDMVRSLAIHQDADGLVAFIQTLVDAEVAKGAPPVKPVPPSAVEQAILALVKANAS